MKYKFVGQLFESNPTSYGLRGDRFLWSALQKRLARTPIPHSTTDLARLLQDAFETETGFVLSLLEVGRCDQFAHGGMSSGQIDGYFWRDKGFPLIISRYQRQSSSSENGANTKIVKYADGN